MAYKLPKQEPVAIVGSSCRFAGDATTPSDLWDLLKSPRDLSKEVPAERFNIKAFYHPDGEYHGTTNSPKAYWLEQDHRIFDATFFNITPKEAEAIDPQQRMQLEVVYEALEVAGYTLQQYAGQNVAVFSGVMTADYDTLSQRDDLTASQYYATGNARSIIANRVSYFFNFNGPSMTVDTACSSSLVALHQAVLSLRSGESIMACVTGVNLMLVPEQFIVEANLHMLSPTGHCRMWDANADGYARGEGVAALFLKPLSRAIIDGDQIQAIIRETGVNSDGRTKGITMPNPQAQARLIRETYHRARLDPRDPADRCQFFEAHGTGTQAGDPTEASAIEEAFFGTGTTHEEVSEVGNEAPFCSGSDLTICRGGMIRIHTHHLNPGSWLAR
jgi:acyl transferase domain-containing protein